MKRSAILGAVLVIAAWVAVLSASASTLSLQAQDLSAQTASAAMCDRDVTITPVEVLGITASVTVSNISSACNGWTLRVQITNSADNPFGPDLSRVVDQTSEGFLALSIGQFPGPNRYYYVFEPPS